MLFAENLTSRNNVTWVDHQLIRGVEIQCQWHQLSGAKSELGTAGLVIGNLLLSTLLKIIT